MDAAVPYAVDEQLRVEALRAAASVCGRCDPDDVLAAADRFHAWLLAGED